MKGPNHGRAMTQREIALALGVSHALVQQIEACALEKLRRALGAPPGRLSKSMRAEVERQLRRTRSGS